MHNYHAAHKILPPATINAGSCDCDKVFPATEEIRNHTGYMMLLPFLELNTIYDRIDFARPTGFARYTDGCTRIVPAVVWQTAATDNFIPGFVCPSDTLWESPHTSSSATYMHNNAHRVSYGFATHTVDRYMVPAYSQLVTPLKSAWGFNGAARLDDIKDGTSNTMVMIETRLRKFAGNVGPFWSQYVYYFFIAPAYDGINRLRPGYEYPYGCAAGSAHPGGAQMLKADGSVHFLSDTVETSVIEALVSIAAGDVVGEY